MMTVSAGCEKILELAKGLTERDLVFTCVANGVSSLLTLPASGLTLGDLRKTTLVTQIERGMTTRELNPIRNHLDRMKGGRISSYFHPAKMIHIISIDPGTYEQRMHQNYWLHNLPDCTTFQDAIESLKRYDAWKAVPVAVRKHLEKADPREETLKAGDFEKMSFRIFGLMPGHWQSGKVLPAMKKAEELGFKPYIVADQLIEIEASQAGIYMASMANTIERRGQPFEPPCALFSSGELVVTVGQGEGDRGAKPGVRPLRRPEDHGERENRYRLSGHRRNRRPGLSVLRRGEGNSLSLRGDRGWLDGGRGQ